MVYLSLNEKKEIKYFNDVYLVETVIQPSTPEVSVVEWTC